MPGVPVTAQRAGRRHREAPRRHKRKPTWRTTPEFRSCVRRCRRIWGRPAAAVWIRLPMSRPMQRSAVSVRSSDRRIRRCENARSAFCRSTYRGSGRPRISGRRARTPTSAARHVPKRRPPYARRSFITGQSRGCQRRSRPAARRGRGPAKTAPVLLAKWRWADLQEGSQSRARGVNYQPIWRSLPCLFASATSRRNCPE